MYDISISISISYYQILFVFCINDFSEILDQAPKGQTKNNLFQNTLNVLLL